LPDIRKKVLTKNDKFILLGCDGIFEIYSNQKLINVLDDRLKKQNYTNLYEPLENLLDELIAPDTTYGSGCDNMTSILVVFNQDN